MARHFSQKLMIRAGALSGEKYSRGSGSKTMTSDGSASSRDFSSRVPDHRLVTQMHTIKGTDRRHATPVLGPQIVQAANQFHSIRETPVNPNAAV